MSAFFPTSNVPIWSSMCRERAPLIVAISNICLSGHCSYMNELLDPEIMKHYGCNISHQPVSNASFGFWPNMIPFIKAGVNVSLGTDGQTQSMFENMRDGRRPPP